MNEIIEALHTAKWRVTMHDVGLDTAVLVLAVVIDDPTDMWYLGRFCMENDFDMGACFYVPKSGVVYFPLHKIDTKAYQKIMSI